MAKSKYPETIFVYTCDYDDGKPVFAVATSLNDISEDNFSEPVAQYKLVKTSKVKILRQHNF